MSSSIDIIGGGVSGITTGLTLQLLGFDTTCYTESVVAADTTPDPRFASLYPAASVIPHSVRTDELDPLFPASQAVFRCLYQQQLRGMARHRHYEIFESATPRPAYAGFMDHFTPASQIHPSHLPRRSGAPKLHGWAFDCYIAGWPVYMDRLYELYERSGGKLIRKKVTKSDIAKLPAERIVNCSGVWATDLFNDPAGQRLIRGHLIHVPGRQPVRDTEGRTVSYNYTPRPSVYSTPGGEPSDVYFYPVGDKWILGGSRQRGTLDKAGNWQGENHRDVMKIDGTSVPRPILELNKTLLEQTIGQPVQWDLGRMRARVGYRFTRPEPHQGLRLAAGSAHGKTVIHNYGHGGAGVTLSWGCALRVGALLQRPHAPPAGLDAPDRYGPGSLLTKLQGLLHELYMKHFSSQPKP